MTDSEDRILLALDRLEARLDRLDANHERGLLAVERRLGAIEDAVAGWAEHYWSHVEHPPRPT